MLTRAYDAIMAALQVPMITNQNVDFNNSAIDDSVLNCKDFSGNVRTIFSSGSYYDGNALRSVNLYSYNIPFAYWQPRAFSYLHPDEDELEPNYEDFRAYEDVNNRWTVSSSVVSFSKTYDQDTKEFVCSVRVLWQNTSGAAKTVYGVKVRSTYTCRKSYSGTSGENINFLVCREHFASPVVVEDQGIIALTFTWRVGRAGLVSATAASAE